MNDTAFSALYIRRFLYRFKSTMRCTDPNCKGELEDIACPACGKKWPLPSGTAGSIAAPVTERRRGSGFNLMKISQKLRTIDDSPESVKQELMNLSISLERIVPDKYDAWRAQADLWLTALHELETRQLSADASVLLMGVPLLEAPLRDAAEGALRHCAHFALTREERIALIDEANQVRNTTWF